MDDGVATDSFEDMAPRGPVPGLEHEKHLWASGHEVVVGMDEVGRGAWAGPLTVAAAVIPTNRRINGLRDSKMLSEKRRESLFERVDSWCTSWSLGHATPDECDRFGMSRALQLAAWRALEVLDRRPDAVLLDGNLDFVGDAAGPGGTHLVVKGDATVASIAAASVLAKVSRDRLMRSMAEDFPQYDFERNKGYPCPRHRMALCGYGPTSIHRRSWAFMDSIPWMSGASVERVGLPMRLF